MITCRRQPACLTLMPALAQCFGDWYATETCLARPARVHVHQLPASFCRFVGQFADERRPSGIVDGLRQHPAGQSLDVQVFHRNHAIGVDQGAGRFAVEVRPLVLYVCMSLLQEEHGLPAVTSPALTPGDTPLGNPKDPLGLAVATWVRNRFPCREGGEGCQPDIEPHGLIGHWQGFRTIFDAEAHAPLSSGALHRYGLDDAFKRAMPLDFEMSNALQVQSPCISQSAPITPTGEGVAVEASARL